MFQPPPPEALIKCSCVAQRFSTFDPAHRKHFLCEEHCGERPCHGLGNTTIWLVPLLCYPVRLTEVSCWQGFSYSECSRLAAIRALMKYVHISSSFLVRLFRTDSEFKLVVHSTKSVRCRLLDRYVSHRSMDMTVIHSLSIQRKGQIVWVSLISARSLK